MADDLGVDHDGVEHGVGLGNSGFGADPARCEFTQQRMQTGAVLVAKLGHVTMAFREEPKHSDVVIRAHPARRSDRNAAIATERASLGSFFCERPEPSTRNPRREHRRNVEHRLARSDELLGKEVAETVR